VEPFQALEEEIRGIFKRIGIKLGLQILIFLAKDYLRPYLVKTIRNNPFL